MLIKNCLNRLPLICLLLGLIATVSFAQGAGAGSGRGEGTLSCRDNWNSNRLVGFCAIQEQTLPAAGAISVDGRMNGGVSVKGWDQNNILVRFAVQTAARSQAEAKALADQIHVQTSGAQIHADGPEQQEDFNWSVSYEIFVPRQSDISIKTYNGGISVSAVRGRIEFDALNGGVSLNHLAGTVHGSTTNGGINVQLQGDRWDGDGIDVSTTNGGVNIALPENYSAHLETGTINGSIRVDFPITVQGEIKRDLTVDLGSGGPTIRVTTTNGGVSIKHAG